MKVNGISELLNDKKYTPMQDRILSNIITQANKARREGKSEATMIMKDSPALWKAVESATQYFDVYTEKSDSVKVTVKL